MSESQNLPSGSQAEAQLLQPSRTSVPKMQLGVLCTMRILDPLNFSQIFPYINQFLVDLRITNDISQIGYYSGIVESSFAICQLLSIYPWTSASNFMGRRPVILLGAAGLSMSTICFGLSTNFTSLLIFRGLAGLFSGNIAVIPAALSDITNESNQAFIYPFFGLWWPAGAIIGPLIGGMLSNPTKKYQSMNKFKFLKTYPYFLPCFVVSVFTAIGVVIGYFFLEETFRPSCPEPQAQVSYGTMEIPQKVQGPSRPMSIRQLLSIPVIQALCMSGCALSFISTAFDVLFVLFCYSPVDAGGLGFSISEIGFSLAAAGAVSALLQLLFMPILLRRFDHAKIYHSCMRVWPSTFASLPFLSLIARNGMNTTTGRMDPGTTAVLWACIIVILSMARVGFLGYSVNMLLIKRHSPDPSSVASTNALVQFFICFSRAFSPALVSATYAISTNFDGLGHYSWVLVMVSLSVSTCSLSKRIVKESAKT
ncbi:major facilitator superfamily domain-containing protein [Infundibulicybe gibba]|nr:major facilitator superfamily domain-containing protein [Infundibulicybe gibba]